MIFVYAGNDEARVRDEANAKRASYDRDTYDVVTLSVEEGTPDVLRDYATRTSLFGKTTVLFLDGRGSEKEMCERVISLRDVLGASSAHSIVVFGTIPVGMRAQLEKLTDEIFEYKKTAKADFASFAIVDAYKARDKKKLWLCYHDAVARGETMESIVGILVWQIRVLIVVAQSASAAEAKLKPFVYDGAKRALSRFTLEELRRHARELMHLYHDAHQGLTRSDEALEHWILRGL